MKPRWFDEMTFEEVERDVIVIAVAILTAVIAFLSYLIFG